MRSFSDAFASAACLSVSRPDLGGIISSSSTFSLSTACSSGKELAQGGSGAAGPIALRQTTFLMFAPTSASSSPSASSSGSEGDAVKGVLAFVAGIFGLIAPPSRRGATLHWNAAAGLCFSTTVHGERFGKRLRGLGRGAGAAA